MSAFTLYIPPKGHTLILRDALDINKLSPDRNIISPISQKCFTSSDFTGCYGKNGEKNWILSGDWLKKAIATDFIKNNWSVSNIFSGEMQKDPNRFECMIPVVIPAGTEMVVTYYSIRGNHYESSFIRFRVSSLKITVDIPIKKLNTVYFEEYVEEAQGKTTKNKSNIVI